ncbi:MAG TPA: PAS domain S-box protein [Kofleriaceae bacterium]|nr:PAS domain S-box protein [Kofleriaceae bacterium]
MAPAVFVCVAAYIAAFGSLGLAPSEAATLFDVAVLAALGVLATAVFARRVPLAWAHAASAATLWAPLAATLAPLWSTHDDAYATLFVMQIASAGVLLDTRWLAATMVVFDTVAIAMIVAIGGPTCALLVSCVITGSLFAVLIHILMRRAILNAESMRHEFRALLESSPEPMFVHADAGAGHAIRWMNASLLRLLGYDRPDELIGKRSIDTFVHPDDRARLVEHRERVQRGECQPGIDVRWLRRDGATRHVHAESRRVTLAGEASWLVVARDMTDQIERERERVAAEAAIRKSEEQLQQAQRMESIGQLAGGVAHDFNNLLAAILSNANLVADELGDDHPAIAEVRDIEAATNRAAALTRQLLTFSRKQPRKVSDVALNGVVTNLEKMLSRLVSEDIEMRAVLAPQLGTVRGDSS